MSKLRAFLLVVIAAVFGAYGGYFYSTINNPWADESLRIVGITADGLADAADRTSPLRTEAGEMAQAGRELSPTMAVAKCRIKSFRIDTATHGFEWAIVPMREITPEELRCLIEASGTEFEGTPPGSQVPSSMPPHYRALTLSLEKLTENAQTH